MQKNNRLLTVQEVARELGVDSATVRRWVREGLIEGISLLGHVRHRHRISEETLQAIKKGLPKPTGRE